MSQRHVRQLLAVAFAIGVFTGLSVAPVAASESVDLGGDDGISIGTDGIGLGGDDGIQIGVDPEDGLNASVGGDEGVNVGVGAEDGVDASVGGDEGVNVGVDAEDGVDASVGGDEGVEVGASPEDGVEAGTGGESVSVGPDGVEAGDADLTDGGLEDVGSQVEDLSDGENGFDAADGGLGDADLGDGEVPTDPTDIELDTDDIPEDARLLTQILQSLPETNETGPEDFPIGDDRATVDVCDPLDLEADDLPVGALPGLGDLPRELQPPGLPADLITPEALFGIVLGFVPAPCEVVNPNDPQIDPTDPPDEPRAQLDVVQLGERNGGPIGVVEGEATLNDSGEGPGITGVLYTGKNLEFGDSGFDLVVNDGRNDYGAKPRFRYDEDGVRYEAVLILLGKNAGIEGSCQSLENYDGDLLTLDLEELEDNPLGPCEYKLVGLPNLFGPGDLFGVLNDLAESDEPPVDLGALPVNPDALLNL